MTAPSFAKLALIGALALSGCARKKPPAPAPTLTRVLAATAEAIRAGDYWTANQRLATLGAELGGYRGATGLSARSALEVDRLRMEAEELAAAGLEGERLQLGWNGFFLRLTRVLHGEEVEAWPRLRVDLPNEVTEAIAEVDAAVAGHDRGVLCGAFDKTAWLLAGWAGSDPQSPRSQSVLTAGQALELGNECRELDLSSLRQRWNTALAMLSGSGEGPGETRAYSTRSSRARRRR